MLNKLFKAKLPLFFKFLISSVALVLIISTVAAFSINLLNSKLLETEVKEYYLNYLRQIDNKMCYIINDIDSIAHYDKIKENLNGYETSLPYYKYEKMDNIENELENIMISNDNIIGIELIKGDNVFSSGQYFDDKKIKSEKNWPETSAFYVYDKINQNTSLVYLKRVSFEAENDVLFAYQIHPNFIYKDEDCKLYALNKEGKLIWNKTSNAAKKYDVEVISLESQLEGVTLYLEMGNSKLNNQRKSIAKNISMSVLILFLGCVAVSFFFSRIITKRLIMLKKHMEIFEKTKKHNAIKARKKSKLSVNIRFFYIFVCFIPAMLLIIYFYSVTTNVVNEKIKFSYEQNVSQISDNIHMFINGLRYDSRSFLFNSNDISSENEDAKSYLKKIARREGVSNLALYDKYGTLIYELKSGANSQKLDENLINNLVPYENNYGEKICSIVTTIQNNDIKSGRFMEKTGYLKIDFDYETIKSMLMDDKSRELFIECSGKIIFSKNNFVNEDISAKTDSSFIKKKITDQWTLYGTSKEYEVANYRWILFIGVVLFGVFIFFIVLHFSRRITGMIVAPLQMLNDNLHKMKNKEDFTPLDVKTGDEIESLIDSFNSVSQELDNLINKVYKAELEKAELDVKRRESDFNVLQTQINPHFLYNTFDSLNWLICEGKTTEASNMINSLANMFRLGLNKGEYIIELKNELSHVESYLEIQKMRFSDKLNVFIYSDDELMNCKVIKTILQPIVENSICHGIEPKESCGIIEIYVERVSDNLILKVVDDGIGIPAEKVDEINYKLKNNENMGSVGLKNVNDRIVLAYGKNYGIKIDSHVNAGTTVTLKLPYKE